MADGGPPTPQLTPNIPLGVPPVPPVQPPAPTALPVVPPPQPIQPGPLPQLNWSHSNLISQVNQIKMQKHIFSGLMTGWTPMHFKKVSSSRDFV